jgi:hypothetical protein
MIFTRQLSLLVFFTSVILSGNVCAQGIEIKGLRIGMTEDEVEKKIGRLPVHDFTIAGIRNKYPISQSLGNVDFYDGKLDYFLFVFNSSAFDEVVSAVKDKYPALICENTTVTNAMGAAFKQTKCTLKDELSLLLLSRYGSQINVLAKPDF